MSVLQFPNGSANLTYLLSFGDRRFVLRRPPFGVIAPGRARHVARASACCRACGSEYDRAPQGVRVVSRTTTSSVPTSSSVEYRRGEVVWASLPPSMADLPDAAERDRVGHRRRPRRPAPRRSGGVWAGRPRPTGRFPRSPAGRVAQALGSRRQPRTRGDDGGGRRRSRPPAARRRRWAPSCTTTSSSTTASSSPASPIV